MCPAKSPATPAASVKKMKVVSPAVVTANTVADAVDLIDPPGPVAAPQPAETWSDEGEIFSAYDLYLLGEGSHYKLYEKLGAHPMTVHGVAGVGFAVWAPNAQDVSVVGNFNYWDGSTHRMHKHWNGGVWELFIPGIGVGEVYKYRIFTPEGWALPDKSDPFGFQYELRPRTASIVADMSTYHWRDQEWLANREHTQRHDAPMSVYEVHLGSWRRHWDDGNRFYTYSDLIMELVPYVADMGFTHVEFMPMTEFPYDGSWGYQPIGLFAPTSRFGTPDEFKALVDAFHERGVGVILDFVAGHFPLDPGGLANFDGTHLYDHADPRQGYHPDWNTGIFNYGRKEVTNYLLANALFWAKEYHLDGLRFDAVASMLYLDYSRKAGEWVPNQYGGRENLEAIDFLKKLNEVFYAENKGALTMAEESTAWPGVSRPTYLGGLGFGYKWNMGWMHDSLSYMEKDPAYRKYEHNHITFSMIYHFDENFILPLSHDEVVYGKGSLLQKMPGDCWQQFANLRAYFGFMWGHPGKKLLFMGCEFGQGEEWNYEQGLDWQLLDVSWHEGVRRTVSDLNHLMKREPALYERDFSPEGFEWLEAGDSDNSVLSFLRHSADRHQTILVVSNFTPVVRYDYRIAMPMAAKVYEILNTDAGWYNGSNVGNWGDTWTENQPHNGKDHSVRLTIPPLATVFFRVEPV